MERLPADTKKLVVSGVKTVVAEPKNIVLVVVGKETVSAAVQQTRNAFAEQLATAADIAAKDTSMALHIPVTVGEEVGGNPGKIYMTIVTGEAQYIVEFGVTAADYAAALEKGTDPKIIVGAVVAEAIRTAYAQYDPIAKPVPDNIKAALSSKGYPVEVIKGARYAIGSISIAVPDVINNGIRMFGGGDNAVTVGNITVFSTDPLQDFHWWAHELGHQIQYADWGIDQFAYKYQTSCMDVEQDAENRAQAAYPVTNVTLRCPLSKKEE